MEKQKIHQSKPFPYKLDSNAKALMELLSMVEVQVGQEFSLCGGFARDYGKRPYNDFDICTPNPDGYRTKLAELGFIKIAEDDGADAIPHDMFCNPYGFGEKEHPIHFIHTYYSAAYTPDNFDYSINEFALKSDMRLYAPTYSWRDVNRKLIRLNKSIEVTTNASLRGIRFAAKLGYNFEETTRERIVSFYKSDRPLGSNRVISGIDKMIEDGIEKESFEIMKSLNFPGIENVETIYELRKKHNDLILGGRAHIDHRGGYGNF